MGSGDSAIAGSQLSFVPKKKLKLECGAGQSKEPPEGGGGGRTHNSSST